MQVLLLRPVPRNERFGLGPFFRIEPLGMAFVAAALEAAGHTVTLADLRFSRSVEHYITACRPQVIGIACMHALETDEARALIAQVRRLSPEATLVLGGHAAAAFPEAFFDTSVDVIVLDDGERAMPAAVEAIERGRALTEVPGLVVRTPDGFVRTADPGPSVSLDVVPVPSRRHVEGWRRHTPASRTARRSSSRRRAAVRSGARSVPSGRCTTASFANGASRPSAATRRRSAITSSSPTICSGTMARAARRWRRS